MATIQTPSLTGFNNSVVVGQTKFDVNKFTDLNSLYSLYKKDSFTTYKGMIHLWNQRKLMNTPLISLTELNNSVMYVNGPEGKFRYSIPYDLGLPYSVEDMTGDIERPGIDGQKFKIKLSENCFTNTDIITYDLRDGVTLYITEDEIYEESDGWVYTVTIPTSNKTKSFPKRFLQPGIEFCKITNVNNEYDTQKSSIWLRQGSLDLEMQLGSHRSVYHWITAYADQLKVDGGDPRYGYLNQYSDLRRNNSTLVFFNKDQYGNRIPQSTKWMNRIEAMLWAEMKMMEEKDLMWNKGGIVVGSGNRSARVNTGLYEQMRNGNRVQYTTLTLALIEETLSNLFYNSGIPFEQRRTKIMVGTGAMIEISKLLADDFKHSNPFLVNAGDVKGYLYGNAMNLGFGFRFTSKRWPVAGEVTFEYNPALDNRYNRTQDGLIGEFPIESYTLMIMDITDGGTSNAAGKVREVDYRVQDGFNDSSNLVMIKNEGFADTIWGYELGTHSPLGTKGPIYSSSQRDGYAIWMKNQSSIWLKDATRSVIIEKKRTLF